MSKKHHGSLNEGFTLVELMIAVAILAVIAAIAVPAYRGYITESRLGAMRMNLDTLRIAVEAFRLDDADGDYGDVGKLEAADSGIFDQYGWRPEGESGAYTYVVEVTSASLYEICAASPVGASLTCRRAAGGVFTCTQGTATVVDADSGCP